MNYREKLKERLSGMLFLQLKEEAIYKTFKIDIKNYKNIEEVYVPVDTKYLSSNIENEEAINNLPITVFLEGMFFSLGVDEGFKYNKVYIDIIKSVPSCKNFIKGSIAKSVKEEDLEKAFILVNGLLRIEKDKEVFNKALIICEAIREKNNSFTEVEEDIIEEYLVYHDDKEGYFYKSLILRDKEEYELSLINLDEYLNKGGEKTKEILDFRQWLQSAVNYENGKALVYDNPKKAIELLSSLLEEFEDNPLLYYHLAVSYRVLGLNEKSIYYLNDALRIDSAFAEPLNELGLNYACLGHYETAIEYFKKVFEVTKSIEVCTNIAMCYIKLGKYKDAELHLNIAEKIDPEDEIVKDIRTTLNK